MLSNEKVKKALEDKEIEITVSFGFKEGVPVSYEKEEAFLSSSLKVSWNTISTPNSFIFFSITGVNPSFILP